MTTHDDKAVLDSICARAWLDLSELQRLTLQLMFTAEQTEGQAFEAREICAEPDNPQRVGFTKKAMGALVSRGIVVCRGEDPYRVAMTPEARVLILAGMAEAVIDWK